MRAPLAAGGTPEPRVAVACPLLNQNPAEASAAAAAANRTMSLSLRRWILEFRVRWPRAIVDPDSIVMFAHTWVGRLNEPLRRKYSRQGLRQTELRRP